ncbi:MAG: M60 family metallopeptidase [Saprospiraceae bacterium]
MLLTRLLLICSLVIPGLSFPSQILASVPPGLPEYLQALTDLEDHINQVAILSDAELEALQTVIQDNITLLADDEEAIQRSFEVIDLFEATVGPLFTTPQTKNGFNRAVATDGLNLHRDIMLIQQGLLDHAYSPFILATYPDLLEGRLFQTATYFPGAVAPPADPNQEEAATIKADYLLSPGTQPWTNIGNDHTIRPTGCYLAPGSIAEVTVPISLVGKGINIRVGAHFWNLSGKNNYKRMDRVSIVYPIDSTTTRIANPIGGGIYIELPLGVNEGLVDISLKNVVRAPFFSKKTFDTTTLSEWQSTERMHPAPWADFETDKFMMQVPTSWIYNFDDPETLMTDWDKSMDAVSDLLGRPRITDRHKNYLQFDVIIRGSAYHPGYPMSNTPYNPNDNTDGTPKHNILKGPQFNQDIHFHELGHEVAISKFVGETEALVNFLYVPVLNRCFGVSLEEAFAKSFGPSYNFFTTKENIVKTRLVSDSFQEGVPRNTCNCTKNEVRYQHRGYAHYVDIVELFGYEALEKFWKAEGDAADAGNPYPVNDQDQDDRILRMSIAAGVDMRPLFHFWGLHPKDPEGLAQLMADNELALPMSIKKKLHAYKKLIPLNKEEFIAHGQEMYPNFLNYSGNQFDYGEGWYKATAEYYDDTTAATITKHLSDLIILYYGTDCCEVDTFAVPTFDLQQAYCTGEPAEGLPDLSENGVTGMWMPGEIQTSTGGEFVYTFSPEPSSCAEDAQVTVTIHDPVEPTIYGENVLCPGDSTWLSTADPIVSWQWEQNGVTIGSDSIIVVKEGGTVTLTSVDENGCSSQVMFDVDQSSPILIDLVDQNVIVTGGTQPYQIDIDTIGSTIEVTVTDANGCMGTETFMLNATNDIQPGQAISIYPMPVRDQFRFDLGPMNGQLLEVNLFATDGRQVAHLAWQGDVVQLPTLDSGMYVVQFVLVQGSTLYQRILVQQ